MKVFLVRHAEAQHFTADPGRHLTEKGKSEAQAIGSFLRDSGQFDPAFIWHSGLPRSQQTADILRQVAATEAKLVERTDLLPESDPADALGALARLDQSVALVGHHPHLHELFAGMMGSSLDPELWEIVNGGVACISGHDFYSGMGCRQRRWSIYWMLTPRLLRGIDHPHI